MRANAAVTAIVEGYCTAWSESDRSERVDLLRSVVSDDVTYADPTVSIAGIEKLADHIEAVIARYPGSTIALTSFVDMHGQYLRFAWRKVLANGESLPEGTDFCELSPDCKLSRIVGFFGPLHPTAALETPR